MGDQVGRKYIWLTATLLGVLGNFLIAAAQNVGTGKSSTSYLAHFCDAHL
jgi:hypothetical protein